MSKGSLHRDRKMPELAGVSENRPTSRIQLVVLLGVIGLFQLITIRSGHIWGDDFALYILHARALLEGAPYGATNFIYHPETPWYSPRIYPPGFPLLLLPILALLGLNYVAMKVLIVLFFVGAIGILALIMRPVLPPTFVLVVVALLGFQPYLTDFKNNVLPDLPFIFFVTASLYLILRFNTPGMSLRRSVILGMVAGAVAVFGMSVRTIGIAVFAGAVLAEVARFRRPSAAIVTFLLTALALYWAQQMLTPPASGYGSQISDVASARSVWSLLPEVGKAKDLVGETFLMWNGLSRSIRNWAGLLVIGLSVLGFVMRLRISASVIETFVIAYAGAIFLFPALNLRYILPLVPFMLYYAAVATCAAVVRWRWMKVPAAALVVVLAGGYVAEFSRAEYGRINDQATGPAALEMYSAVVACAEPEDRVLFGRPRVLALYTGRPSLVVPGSGRDVAEFMADNDIRHAVAERGDRLDVLLRQSPDRFHVVFDNGSFLLYTRVPAGERAGQAFERCSAIDGPRLSS